VVVGGNVFRNHGEYNHPASRSNEQMPSEGKSMRVSLLKLSALLALLLAALTAGAQTNPLASPTTAPTSTPSAASASKPAIPADRLGRETPRGCVFGFMRAAREENYKIAVQYFQPSAGRHRASVEQEQDLAAQLLSILNEKFTPSALDGLSRDPNGTLDDGLPPDEEAFTGSRTGGAAFALALIHAEDEHGTKLWYISRKTLEQVPDVYDSLHFARIEKSLPAVLVNRRPLAMPLWQWIAVVLFVPVSLGIAWVVVQLVLLARAMLRRLRGEAPGEPASRQLGPGAYLLAALIHYEFVTQIGASLYYRQYYSRVIWILLAAAFYWATIRVTRAVSKRIGARLTASGRLAERSLVSLGRRVLDVAIFVLLVLVVLSAMGVNVTAPLAGLGIGGLAIGLGAQKTFENLLGGISILSDRALQAGDSCKIGDQIGIVEDIGLRSTKLRTADRTLVSIPNGMMATAVLENYRLRDKMLCRQIVRLRFDMSPEHIQYVLKEIRDVLAAHPKVENKSSRVRLTRFADYAFEVEIFAYILERQPEDFLAEQEALILQVLDALDKSGAGIALPSVSSVVSQDGWVNPEKGKRAAPGSPDAGGTPRGNESSPKE